MYLGRVVEIGPTDKIIKDPLHPYTRALLAAVPNPDPDKREDKNLLTGDVPSPASPPPGCHFHPRCSEAKPECKEWEFKLIERDNNRKVACLLY